MLVLTRKEEEKIIIDGEIEVTVLEIEKGQVQLGIEAPKEIEIHREEVYRRIERENIAAGQQQVDLDMLKKVSVDGENQEDKEVQENGESRG